MLFGGTVKSIWIKIDPAHSAINFTVRHMMISTVRGQFEEFDGTIEFDEENPEHSTVDVRIDATSTNTREPKRDALLRSADFLDVEKGDIASKCQRKTAVLKASYHPGDRHPVQHRFVGQVVFPLSSKHQPQDLHRPAQAGLVVRRPQVTHLREGAHSEPIETFAKSIFGAISYGIGGYKRSSGRWGDPDQDHQPLVAFIPDAVRQSGRSPGG